jgi:hypothetical protein
LVGKLKGKRPIRRPKHKWEGNINTYLRQAGMKGVDWIDLVQDADQQPGLLNTVMCLQTP